MRGRVSRQHASLAHMSIIMFCINTCDDFKIVFDETTTGKVGVGKIKVLPRMHHQRHISGLTVSELKCLYLIYAARQTHYTA